MSLSSRWRNGRRGVMLRDYLAAHALEPLTLRQVSRSLGMSESTVQRALRANIGVGFHATLACVRVELALSMLLEDPDVKIEALALAVGWRSKKSLYAAVRRVTGRSLQELRFDANLLNYCRADLRGKTGLAFVSFG